MALLLKLVMICTACVLTAGQLNFDSPRTVPDYIQTQSSYVEVLQKPLSPDDDVITVQQLPKAESPRPFNTAEPSTVLKAPTEDAYIMNFNTQHPAAPSETLQLPSLLRWNPENDPNLYYPIADQKLPTNLYPKKYNKNTLKTKPLSLKTKSDQSAPKQKQIDKLLMTYAKQENKKLLELEKFSVISDSDNIQKVNDAHFSPSSISFPSSSSGLFQDKKKMLELKNFSDIDNIRKANDTVTAESNDAHFSPSFSSSGLLHTLNPVVGEAHAARLQFHIQGHDGPKSYKWGYDTGKGKNRHFRFEERDKEGVVTGQYGYYDTHGKLRIVHYDSHPHEGFHASEGQSEY